LPILEEKCVNCHGASSIKGGLALNDTAGLLNGGKTGPLLVAGQAALSLMMQRIYLPPTNKKHMPPRAKEQLTEAEIALLHAWIQSGAVLHEKVISLPPQDSFRMLAAAYLLPGSTASEQTAYDFPPAEHGLVKSLNNNYRLITPLGNGSPALAVHFYGKNMYSRQALEELTPLKQQITELNLARMPVKNEDLKSIGQMPNLRKLNLNYTDINDAGLVYLNGISKLQDVSLSGTAITEKGLEQLARLPSLRIVYIWDTKIDSGYVTALQNRFKNVRVEMGYQEGRQTILALTPPIIKKESGVFEENMEVELKHPFRGVDMRYTLDGSAPDSVNSPLYKNPIPVDQHTTITARAFKQGWHGSKPVQVVYIKGIHKPDSVALGTLPDPAYSNSTANMLTDKEVGDTAFWNGKWLGYKNEAVYYLYFNQPVTANEVLLNALKFTGADIFPPAKIEIWGGMDNQQLRLLGSTTVRIPAKNEPAAMIQPLVKIAPQPVKCLKIKVQPVKALPSWRPGKGKQALVLVSEIVVN
jgi:hypothetical protein